VQAEHLKAFALAKPLLTGIDAANYRSVKANDGQFAEAIPALLAFYRQPDANFGRRGFLEMMCAPDVANVDRRMVFTTLARGPAKGGMTADEIDALLKVAWHIGEREFMEEAVELAALALRDSPDHTGLLRRACNLAFRVPASPITATIVNVAERALQMMADKLLAVDTRLVRESGRLIANRANEAQAERAFASVSAIVGADKRPPQTLRLFYPWFQSSSPPSRQLARALMEKRAVTGRASDTELAILKWRPAG
jgi:hypothetical protein